MWPNFLAQSAPSRARLSSEIRALAAIALTAQELEILDAVRTAEGKRNHVVVLQVEVAAALHALTAVTLEYEPTDLARNRLAPLPCAWCCSSLFDVKQHVGSVKSLRGLPLAISDKRHHVPGAVVAGLPVEGVLKPPPHSAAGLRHAHGLPLLHDAELAELGYVVPNRRAARSGEPAATAEQESAVKEKVRVGVLTQLRTGRRGGSPGEWRCGWYTNGHQGQHGYQHEHDRARDD